MKCDTLVQILSRDERGRPKQCVIMHDDELAHLKGGEEFLRVEIDEDLLDPKRAERRKYEIARRKGGVRRKE